MNNEDLNTINKTSPNLLDERLTELKRLFPDLFDGNGNLNEKELKDLLSKYTTPQVEKFTFEWGGKSASKKLAFTPSKATLVPDRERSVNFDETQNLIIEGDNLHVLKLLQASYANKIKCIYIDPPYNTGKDFIYSDNYRATEKEYWEKNGQVHDGVKLDSNFETNGRLHSSWLSMMQSRLLLSRKLLKNDGVIFVSIGDEEVHNLKKLLDEVFGEENFEGHIHWRRRHNQPNDKTKMIGLVAEHILVYAKNSVDLKLSGVGKVGLTGNFSNPDNDPRGDWASKPWKVGTGQSGTRYTIVTPTGKTYEEEWMGDETTYNNLLNDKRIIFPSNGNGVPRKKYFKSEREEEGQCATNWWGHEQFGSNQDGSSELGELLGESGLFDNPKPSKLIENIISLSNAKDSDIVMDFFAGSGTTAQAVMRFNEDNNTNLKYILVQIPEYIKETNIAYTAGYRRISDITIDRVQKAGESVGTGNVDKGFKVYKQVYSHFPENTWRPDSNLSDTENQKLFKEYLEKAKAKSVTLFSDFDFESVLSEILLKQGFELNYSLNKLNTFENNDVFIVRDNTKQTLISLDKTLHQDTIDTLIGNHIKDRFICVETSLDTTNKWKLSKALGKNLEVVS